VIALPGSHVEPVDFTRQSPCALLVGQTRDIPETAPNSGPVFITTPALGRGASSSFGWLRLRLGFTHAKLSYIITCWFVNVAHTALWHLNSSPGTQTSFIHLSVI
jgi:hypothetical protein